MNEQFLVLIALAITLLIVAVVGHALWLGFAWFFRLIFGRSQPRHGESSRACPRCGVLLAPLATACARCGWTKQPAGPATGPLSDLQATARQMERFRQSGTVALATYERVIQAIEAEEQRLAAAQRTAPAHPAAAPPAPPIMLPPALAMPQGTTGSMPIGWRDPSPPKSHLAMPQGTTGSIPMATPAPGDSLAELFPPLSQVAGTSPPTAPQPPYAVPVEPLTGYSLAAPAEPAVPPAERVPAVTDRMKAAETIQPVGQGAAPVSAPHRARPLSLGQPQQFLPPAPPRKPFSEMLAAFMEEKNIRWGEVVGGLLIIGCSIALVFSLWSTIEKIEILKFFLFTGVTSAIFGVGLYTEHRWKLPTTSRGVLIIATLLVPLNFLAIGAFSKSTQVHEVQNQTGEPVAIAAEPPAEWQVLLGEAVAFAAFLWLVQRSGRVIVPDWSWILTAGVMGASLAQLLIRRLSDTDAGLGMLFALGAVPLVCYGGTTGWMLRRTREWKEVGEAEANLIFILFGSATFAVLLAFGLLIYNTGRPGETLRDLAPLVSLGGVPALASGLVLWRRLADAKLAAVRTAGTSIAVLGAVVLLAGIVMAWPNPSGMLPVALLDFAALTAIALIFELPAAHLLATPCLVLAYLIGVHLGLPADHPHHVSWTSTASEMLRSLFSASSGTGLVAMVLVFGAGSEGLRRLGRTLDAQFYRIVTGATALVSFVLVTWFGFGRTGDPHWATAVYALYATAAFAGAWRMKLPQITWAGTGLALLAIVQAVVFKFANQPDLIHGHQDPYYWQLAILVHATVALLVAAAARWVAGVESSSPQPGQSASLGVLGARRLDPSHPVDAKRLFADPLSLSAVASSMLAIPFWLYASPNETTTVFAEYTFWLAAVWFAISFLHRLAGLFTAAQLMLSLGVVFAVTARLETTEWFAASAHPLLDPWTLQAQGIALALLSLAWVVARIGFRRFVVTAFMRSEATDEVATNLDAPINRRNTNTADWRGTISWLLHPPWPPLDRLVTALVLLGFVAMAVYGVTPGIVQEMAPRAASDVPAWSIAGIPHTHVLSTGSWVLLALLVVVLAAALWEQFEQWLVLGGMLALAAACPLLAGLWDAEVATGSALRWLAAGFLVLGSLPIWFRARVRQLVAPLGWPTMEQRSAGLANESRMLLLILTMTPVLALTLYPAAATIWGHGVVGVAPGSVFGRLGDSVSYVVPLVLVSLALVGHAVRERSAGFAFSAGLVLNLTVTLGYVLSIVTSASPSFGNVEWVRLIQLNAIATAGFALAWLNSRGWLLRVFTGAEPATAGVLLKLDVALGLALNLLVLVPADLWLFLSPQSIGASVVERGSPLGWLALATAVTAAAWLGKSKGAQPSAGVICACLLAIGSMVAFGLCNWDSAYTPSGPPALGIGQSAAWLGYHTLLVSRVAAAWLILALGWMVRGRADGGEATTWQFPFSVDWHAAVEKWTTAVAVLAVILALRDAVDMRDPDRPWWAAGALVALSVLMAALARWGLVRGYVYWAGILGNLAASSWCLVELWPANGHIFDTVHVNVVALALPAVAWLALELQVFRREQPMGRPRIGLPAFHHVAAIGSLVTMAGVVGLGLFADAIGFPQDPIASLGWTALVSVGVIVTACLWDKRAKYAMPALYLLGLVAVGMTVDQFDLTTHWLGWDGVIILAAYSVATSYLWTQRDRLLALGDALRIPRRSESPLGGQAWLLVANQLLATGVVVLAYWIVLTFAEYPLRLVAGKAAISQALAVGLLAQGTRRTQLQKVSLALVAIGAVAWGWAWLDPFTTGNLLNRAVVVLTVLAAMTALYGIGLVKLFPRETEWTRAAQQLVPSLLGLGAVSLVLILGTEVVQWMKYGFEWMDREDVAMAPAAIAAVFASLAGLSVAALVAAVVPGRDPLRLSERGRMLYVYAAEALAALLFMHVRLTMPWLFHGWFMRYWTLIVIALAFLGVGLSEIFRRQNRLVLAEPLERTGVFLPALPVMSLWILQSEVNYSVQLLIIGVMYAALSVARKSFGFGLLAALAANSGLWYHLQHLGGYGLFQHPQLWLIPAALSVLAAAYLNREQLKEEQFVVIRYIAIMIVYVSSTGDIFLNGVKDAPWLPMVLAGLSVSGIFAGIMMRVRAFLFLGASFLVLSLITMILSAHLNLGWAWLWWVAGISLGVAIIAVFALFEKKRNEVLQVVDGLKQWER